MNSCHEKWVPYCIHTLQRMILWRSWSGCRQSLVFAFIIEICNKDPFLMNSSLQTFAELQIRNFCQPESLGTFGISLHKKKTYCCYSLEVPQLRSTNEYPQHVVGEIRRKKQNKTQNKKNKQKQQQQQHIFGYPSCLELCLWLQKLIF